MDSDSLRWIQIDLKGGQTVMRSGQAAPGRWVFLLFPPLFSLFSSSFSPLFLFLFPLFLFLFPLFLWRGAGTGGGQAAPVRWISDAQPSVRSTIRYNPLLWDPPCITIHYFEILHTLQSITMRPIMHCNLTSVREDPCNCTLPQYMLVPSATESWRARVLPKCCCLQDDQVQRCWWMLHAGIIQRSAGL